MSYIINIGIKSELANHVLCNFRFGSSMQLSSSNSVSFSSPNNTKNAKIIGLRNNIHKLPTTFRGTNVEFKLDEFGKLFKQNLIYTSELHSNKNGLEAVLMEQNSVVVAVGETGMRTYVYDVGMTLFSRLPYGINAASIYAEGEVNFAFRVTDSGEGQLECDIYDKNTKKIIGLIDYITDSGSGSYSTLPYGETPSEIEENRSVLALLDLSSDIVCDYGHSYPKKRMMLTISDFNVPRQSVQEVPSEETVYDEQMVGSSTNQANVANKTDNYYLKIVDQTDVHGSWISNLAIGSVVPPNGSFRLNMKSKGHGIQGEVNCDVYYKDDQSEMIQVARLIVEINNDGTAFALFPFVNDVATSEKLSSEPMKFRNTLHVKNVGSFSLSIHS